MDRAETLDHEYTTPTAQVPSTHITDDQFVAIINMMELMKIIQQMEYGTKG